jgi:hypothetical protein
MLDERAFDMGAVLQTDPPPLPRSRTVYATPDRTELDPIAKGHERVKP